MRRFGVLAVSLVLATAPPARAGLTAEALDALGVDPPAGARLPMNLAFADADGGTVTLDNAVGATPAVVILADYTCRTLCSPIVAMVSSALAQSGLEAKRDFHLLVIGIDPKDTPQQAHELVDPQLAVAVAPATRVLMGNAAGVAAVTRAVGYRYAYDAEHDQFAHPSVALVVTREGRLSSVSSALGMQAENLRLALVAAGEGRIGTLADRLRLLCYCYDPATGIYSASITRMLDAAAVATVMVVAGGIATMAWRERKARRG